MNSEYVLIKFSIISQIPYRIFNVKPVNLFIIYTNFNFNITLTLSSYLFNLIWSVLVRFNNNFSSQKQVPPIILLIINDLLKSV